LGYRALVLGLVVGFIFAIAPSCGQAGRCNSTNCRGCCLAGVACQDPVGERACGARGNTCVACGAGQSCINGVCGVNVGSPCGTDQDCGNLFDAAICKTATTISGAPYPGGYCTTKSCNNCPSGSLCAGLGCYGEGDRVCLQTCSANSDCRSGYSCLILNGRLQAGVCWLSSLPSCTPVPPNLIGNACAADSDCRYQAADGGFTDSVCVNNQAYVNGYCTSACDVEGGPHCGTNSLCVPLTSGSFCFFQCTKPLQGQAECRTGYVCEGTSGASRGFCYPDCRNNNGAICAPPTVCLTGVGTARGYCF
jgi:hypothetical protein